MTATIIAVIIIIGFLFMVTASLVYIITKNLVPLDLLGVHLDNPMG